MNKSLMGACLGLLALGVAAPLSAKVAPDEAAKLGQSLTPVGAEKAGNAAGTIPAWQPEPRRGPLSGEFPNNPKIDGEKPLFTITKGNLAEHKEKLTRGHQKLLSSYDSYKMNIYPSHRVIGWPEEIYKATADNAVNCEMIGVDTPNNCKLGFPFPIPKSGAEPMWNHKLKWRGENATRYNNQMIVQPDGNFQLTKIVEDVTFGYSSIKKPVPLTKDEGEFLKYLSKTVAPPRLAGTYILVHEKAGTGAGGRQAWLYTPALKRIRRAPTVCCDNPYEGTDGHQFYDQVDMFNGVLERYDWKLVGKQEMYIPYNANKIAGNKIKYKDLAKPKHLNQDIPRLVIFPEGVNFSEPTRQRGIERLEEHGWHKQAAVAKEMTNVSAPRPGGTLAAIEAARHCHVVIMGHDGFPTGLREVWELLPEEQTIEVRLWHQPAAEVPDEREEQIDWLFEWWRTLDRWVDERQARRSSASRA